MSTVHVYPINDWIDHDTECTAADCTCLCNPRIDYIDPDTGLPYEDPIVVHNAIDGRP